MSGDREAPPGTVRLLALVLVILGGMGLVGFGLVLPTVGPSSTLAGAVFLFVWMLVAGWWLLKGIVWGFILGVAMGAFFLLSGVGAFLSSSYYGPASLVLWLQVAPGVIVLGTLLMPRSRQWFREAWQARVNARATT